MPTYLYGCDTCDVSFESFHSVHDVMYDRCTHMVFVEELKMPAVCGGKISRKVNSTGTFLLKGEGWSSSEAQDLYHETTNDKYRYTNGGNKPWE